MSYNKDISSLLQDWEYQEEKEDKNIRRIQGSNGRELLQVRLPLGVEQYEIHGRPDGVKPEGFESWLDHYYFLAQQFGQEFVLDHEALERLCNESLLYYNRYLLFFQIQEFELCIRDTSRNLRLLKFIRDYAEDAKQLEFLEQYRPYILRMQIMAKALLKVKRDQDIPNALRLLKAGVDEINNLPEMPDNEIFDFERARSLRSLQELIDQLEDQLPVSQEDELKKELDQAIQSEDYEKAAEIRDQLQKLE